MYNISSVIIMIYSYIAHVFFFFSRHGRFLGVQSALSDLGLEDFSEVCGVRRVAVGAVERCRGLLNC